MDLNFYNTLSKKTEKFKPLDENLIKMYVCGPTVYDTPHLGNARSVVVYDILYRLLTHRYGIDRILYVRNITDVDDKINDAAKARGISIQTLTSEMYEHFQADTSALNCLKPNVEPKATEHIPEMISIILTLIDKGYAYERNGHVYFKVAKFEHYWDLSGRSAKDLIAGSRIDVAEDKAASEDFVLWKPADLQDDSSSIFESPWGPGRPGWHIECSAMSMKYLGPNFDIHGGGIDLIFPHHTNEIAQSCACNEGSIYAKTWIHNGFLLVESEKMSKSLGNFITVKQALESGIKGEVIRYVYLSTHYRKPLNWTENGVEIATKALDSFYRILSDYSDLHECIGVHGEFLDALCHDLNTPKALSVLHEIATSHNKEIDLEKKKRFAEELLKCGRMIGLFAHDNANTWFKKDLSVSENTIQELIAERKHAKLEKRFADADAIRAKLTALGISLEDLPNGETKWH